MDRISITTSENGGGVVIVAVSGDLDLLTDDEFTQKLKLQLTSAHRMVVLDLSEVQFLGSSALSVLASSAEEAAAANVDLRLVANARIVLRPLEIAGVNRSLAVFDSVESAIGAG